MVSIGERVADFETDAYVGSEIRKVRLSDYAGKWVVVAFYPADFTFVCPTELVELSENEDRFKSLNAQVLSVSTDTAYVHKAWHDASSTIRRITYPMLADPTGKITKEFGVYIEDEGLAQRGTFIINPEGILKAMDIHDNSIGRSADEILRKLEASKYVSEHNGEVCPASWRPGKNTLKPTVELVGKI